LGRRISIEKAAWTVEPTLDADIVVSACELTDDKREEVKTGRDRIRCSSGAGEVSPSA